jgi:hypothetical protein
MKVQLLHVTLSEQLGPPPNEVGHMEGDILTQEKIKQQYCTQSYIPK